MRKLFLILSAILTLSPLYAQENGTVMSGEFMVTTFYQRQYIDSKKVYPSSYSSSGDKANRPVANAFDGDWLNVWQSASNSGEQSLTATFPLKESISKMVCGLRDRNPSPNGEGYPQTIKVYSSDEASGNEFTYQFTMTSEWSAEKQLFVFPRALECRRIKLVFEDIYKTWQGGGYAEVAELIFLREDKPLDEVLRMFTDKEQMAVSDKYKDERLLEELEQSAQGHMAATYLKERIAHARNIIQGKTTRDSFPHKVTAYQKNGPDSEKYVMIFFSDRYTIDEEEKYYSNVTEHIERVFNYEPFKSMREAFNIYLIFVPSNESNFIGYNVIDSYFQTYVGAAGDGGVDRLSTFTQTGMRRANEKIVEFEEKYLDEGGKVLCANFLMNTTIHGGGGHPFNNGIQGAVYTAGSGGNVLTHELGHAVGSLCDEYVFVPYEDSNMTSEPDGYKSKWSEFMGFRNVTHRHVASGFYRPSSYCLMEYLNYRFCEVCKLAIFERVNEHLADKKDYYIADPIVYYNYTNTYPNEATDGFMEATNGHQLQFRTVIKNLSQQDMTLTVEFTITNAEGTQNRFEVISEEYTVAPGALKSLTATTPTAVSGILNTDKVEARIINKTTGKVIVDYATYKKEFGTVRTMHHLGDNHTETDTQVARTSTVNYLTGSTVEIKPYDINGYSYTKSSRTGDIEIEKDVTTDVIHFYTKNRGDVYITVLDEDGEYEQTITRSVACGETYTPSQDDLPRRENCSLILPESIPTYDGINDIELTYQWRTGIPDDTAIIKIDNDEPNPTYYDLMGNPVKELKKGGIYVTKNKKIIVR